MYREIVFRARDTSLPQIFIVPGERTFMITPLSYNNRFAELTDYSDDPANPLIPLIRWCLSGLRTGTRLIH